MIISTHNCDGNKQVHVMVHYEYHDQRQGSLVQYKPKNKNKAPNK